MEGVGNYARKLRTRLGTRERNSNGMETMEKFPIEAEKVSVPITGRRSKDGWLSEGNFQRGNGGERGTLLPFP